MPRWARGGSLSSFTDGTTGLNTAAVGHNKIDGQIVAELNRSAHIRRLFLVVVRISTTAYAVHYGAKRNDPNQAQPPLLILAENLVERLPRVSELLEVGCSLRQAIGASLQKFDWVTIDRRFERRTAGLVRPICQVLQAGEPVLRPCPNSLFYWRPVLFLARRELQGRFDHFNSKIRHIARLAKLACILGSLWVG